MILDQTGLEGIHQRTPARCSMRPWTASSQIQRREAFTASRAWNVGWARGRADRLRQHAVRLES